ncbi:putative CUB domain-containing protein-like 12 [Homarus americanus]|uniref:Putative CUB domain-containing protein-like 12 n=1 Tax=Homarus americanus TaxID=6706 RepID=A0A8J5JSB1_HOMAM|nr:putative CUB domain-containing protein-like 12 [Homarus americanus]
MVTLALVLMVITGVAADSFQLPAQARALVTEPCGVINMAPGERKAIQDDSNPKANYSPNQRCQWTFKCAPESSTYLEFRCPYFSLEESTSCVNDRLILKSRTNRETCEVLTDEESSKSVTARVVVSRVNIAVKASVSSELVTASNISILRVEFKDSENWVSSLKTPVGLS